MYTETNFKTKKAFKEAVAAGKEVRLWSPGLGKPKENGIEYVEGPWSPLPHTWSAKVEVTNFIVTKVF